MDPTLLNPSPMLQRHLPLKNYPIPSPTQILKIGKIYGVLDLAWPVPYPSLLKQVNLRF